MLLWFQCTSATRSVSSDSAMIDDLGCAALHDHQVMILHEHMSQSSGPIRSKCQSGVHNWALYLLSVHIVHKAGLCRVKCISGWCAAHCIFNSTSSLSKQSQAVCTRPNYIKHPWKQCWRLCKFIGKLASSMASLLCATHWLGMYWHALCIELLSQ